MDANAFHREDYFSARVAYQVYLVGFMLGGTPKLKFKDFLIKFEEDKEALLSEDALKELRKKQSATRTAMAKSIVRAHIKHAEDKGEEDLPEGVRKKLIRARQIELSRHQAEMKKKGLTTKPPKKPPTRR